MSETLPSPEAPDEVDAPDEAAAFLSELKELMSPRIHSPQDLINFSRWNKYFSAFNANGFTLDNTNLVPFGVIERGQSYVFFAYPRGCENDPEKWKIIKALKSPRGSNDDSNRFNDEIDFLNNVSQNPYWVNFAGPQCKAAPGTLLPYYVMEFLSPGLTLDIVQTLNFFKKHRQNPAFVAAILLQIASAINAAHQQGIILRDVKPPNILFIKPTKEEGCVRHIDPGSLKNLRRPRNMTPTGVLFGTSQYLAPETILNDPQNEAVDLHILGVIGFELATGERFYEEISSPITEPKVNHIIGADAEDIREKKIAAIDHEDRRLAELIGGLLIQFPTARPSMQDAATTLQDVVRGSIYTQIVGPAMEQSF